jgi:hypothetical protein
MAVGGRLWDQRREEEKAVSPSFSIGRFGDLEKRLRLQHLDASYIDGPEADPRPVSHGREMTTCA